MMKYIIDAVRADIQGYLFNWRLTPYVSTFFAICIFLKCILLIAFNTLAFAFILLCGRLIQDLPITIDSSNDLETIIMDILAESFYLCLSITIFMYVFRFFKYIINIEEKWRGLQGYPLAYQALFNKIYWVTLLISLNFAAIGYFIYVCFLRRE
ncbi:TPA: hypothetical protein RNW88_001570 [Pasteurella multocida]|uniref:hypothetical protein n=1 Tax=Pasteurella multocida TaxID=747 RepID=UPI001093CAC6|nr:hypothetical protein [Pasteurella multocida]QCA40356.1 hypothetical protein E5138_09430 [Pasteurella multocida]HDX0985204.1 hypothetical protein [Pasteurella multocida]HDX0987537.1 hypothetical protein [Pasteurella multocida]HDX0992373.1 hypothetical protein [Pasteurella multocida]HDX0994609.1 hypothetical protein [Pasteurella multocida]